MSARSTYAVPRAWRSLACALLLAGSLAACGDDGDSSATGSSSTPASTAPSSSPTPAAPTATVLGIQGVDYGYVLSQPSVPAGPVRIDFSNPGKEYHMLEGGLLLPGKTLADVQAALKSTDEGAFESVFGKDDGNGLGGPNILAPGAATSVTVTTFKPGTYAFICFFSVKGTEEPHFARGMVTGLEVTAATSPAPAEPVADAEISIDEKGITGVEAVKSGKGTFKITNTGTREHSLPIVAYVGDTTFAAADKYFEETLDQGKPESPNPPARIEGGLSRLAPGAVTYLHLDLKPGRYVVLDVEGSTDEEDAPEYYKVNPKTSKFEFTVV